MGIGGGTMNAWMEARKILGLEGPRIVTVGMLSGTKILTGQRRDNEKWTNPGGHMDEGETLIEAAIREVFEESGIKLDPEELELVSSERIISLHTGKAFSVFAFKANVPKQKASSKEDPDQEVSKWKWVELSHESPELHPQNRHAQHDSVLCHLGLCREHAPAGEQSFTARRLSRMTDEYTEGFSPVKKEVTSGQDSEGTAADNIARRKY